MDVLPLVRLSLRIKNTAYDDEIQSIIDACENDLMIAGVKRLDQSDPLIKRAHVLYAKANFGFSDNSEKFQKAYDKLRNSLSLSKYYKGET